MADMKVRRYRLDFADEDRVALPFARDLHRPAGIQWQAHGVLIGDWQDVIVLADEDVCTGAVETREETLPLALPGGMVRGTADAVGKSAGEGLLGRCRPGGDQC